MLTEKTYIVIPAHNEEKSIKTVIEDLQNSGYNNIIVVDDGSKDNITQIAQECGASVLTHLINRGQGAALKTGTDYALIQGADIIVHFDADGQMRAEDIKKVIKPILDYDKEVSFGSRFIENTSNMPVLRKILLKLGKIFMRVFFRVNTTDPQSGFRALSRKAAQQIEITQRGMAHCSEILEQVRRKKIPFAEVPVTILYTEYSKQHGQNNLAAIKIASKLIWSKIIR